MDHRHIVNGYEDSAEAIEDILARGTTADWYELDCRLRDDPFGAAAESLEQILASVQMYGTSTIWKNRLRDLRSKAADRR